MTSIEKKVIFYIHLILSIFILGASVYYMLQDIFSVGKSSIGSFFWFTCPGSLVIPLAILALAYLRPRPASRSFYSPLIISLATLIVGIIMFSFESINPDFAFRKHFSSYRDVVGLIEANKIAVNQNGFALLPERYQQILSLSSAVVSVRADATTVYFEDGSSDWDDMSWGYIYRSDGSPPTIDDKCSNWRQTKPETPNWYYCDVHYWVGFPNEMHP